MYDTVFLTTSGLGTRLDGLTQYTNKALVPIGEKYAICRILERFPETTRFVITLGYYGNHVRDFLELAYPSRLFTFVSVHPYEGTGSSQAYSMLCAAKYLQKPFLYHCCDTILPTDYTYPPQDTMKGDITMFVAPHADYATYSGITLKEGGWTIERINRKREAIHDYAYIGVSFIQNPTVFWSTLQQIVETSTDGNIGDTDAYRVLLRRAHISYTVVPRFYDTGNLDSYRHACAAFPRNVIVLAKPNESLCFLREQGRVLKFLHSIPTNERRVARGRMLEGCGPRILGSRPNFMAMSLEEGDVLAECREWGEVRRLLEWMRRTVWSVRCEREEFRDICWHFYNTKTMERLREYSTKHPEDPTWINGCHVGKMEDLLRKVPWSDLCTNVFSHYHGDFILDNILRRSNGSFVLLDWRDSFGGELEWGDVAYDLAKLRHNLVFQHSQIAAGRYSIRKEGEHVFVDLDCKYLLTRQLEELDTWIVENGIADVNNIRILQALIWLNMAPLYEAPLCDFLYAFGKWNLWLVQTANCSRS